MAPGIIKAFGMDEAGLAEMLVYITVGARDTQAPPKENAEFAAKYIAGAELAIPRPVSTHRASIVIRSIRAWAMPRSVSSPRPSRSDRLACRGSVRTVAISVRRGLIEGPRQLGC